MMYGIPMSLDQDVLVAKYRQKSWKNTPQLGQRLSGADKALRPSNHANIVTQKNPFGSADGGSHGFKPTKGQQTSAIFVSHKKTKKPNPSSSQTNPASPPSPQSPLKLASLANSPSLPPTPPKTPSYTNNPYSLEHFTPPIVVNPGDQSDGELEDDEHKIQQRLKQIGFGKSTKGYESYVTLVGKHLRERDNEDHPVTPRANQKCSKRSWDGQLKKWRRQLHRWDNMLPQTCSDAESNEGSERDATGSTDAETPERRSSFSSSGVFDLYVDEPRNKSWGSELSETPDLSEVSSFNDSCSFWM
jgi:hypothetical protein